MEADRGGELERAPQTPGKDCRERQEVSRVRAPSGEPITDYEVVCETAGEMKPEEPPNCPGCRDPQAGWPVP